MSTGYGYPKFKVAAVQAGPIYRDAPQYFDVEATLDKAIGLIEEAGGQGARLIVFPEGWLPCFPYWSMDHNERAAFADMWAKLLWNSVEVPGRETEALCAAAKKANAYVVMGINERDKQLRDRMHNTILYVSPQGEIMGTHRKICITVQERFFHTPGDGGDNLRAVFPTEIGTIGGSICGEHSQLTLVHYWMIQGVQIHCSLWPGHNGMQTAQDIKTRATCLSLGAFGVLAATYIPESDLPKNFYRNSQFSVPHAFAGGSGIINPAGQYVAGPVYDQETIVYGDVDMEEVDRSRYAVSLSGIYSRWDLININVRQESYEPVLPMEAAVTASAANESSEIKQLEARIKQLEQQLNELTSESKAANTKE